MLHTGIERPRLIKVPMVLAIDIHWMEGGEEKQKKHGG